MANNRLKTKGAVVVTGASTGIGEACALRLDQGGGFPVFAGVRRAADGDRLRQKSVGSPDPGSN